MAAAGNGIVSTGELGLCREFEQNVQFGFREAFGKRSDVFEACRHNPFLLVCVRLQEAIRLLAVRTARDDQPAIR
jgi:hypothetical protein